MASKTYVVLLRGVMPTGKNKVPMAELRRVLAEGGFQGSRTYIQTGNVLVKSELSPRQLGEQVRQLIKSQIGPDLAVFVRTRAELQKVLDKNPFREGYDISRVFFVLFDKRPVAEKVAELLADDFGDEELSIAKDAAYMYIPGSYGSNLSNNFLEKKLGISATMRNFNTLTKLVELSATNR